MANWADIQSGIFAGESGGDYGALYGFANRPGKMFGNVDVRNMTINEVLDFQNPRGPYAQYVSALNNGVVSSPAGAYQIVGTTLRDARDRMGLTGDERFDAATQDRIGQWIYETQGTGAWEGYQPQSNEVRQMPQQPAGLLGQITGQPAQPNRRDRMKDIAGSLAVALNELQLRPSAAIPQMVQAGRDRRQQSGQVNRTTEWLSQQPGSEPYLQMIQAGGNPAAVLQAYQAGQAGPESTAMQKNYEFLIARGYSPQEALQAVQGGSVTNISTGTVPPGYQQITDPETGAIRMELIPGSPAAIAQAEAAANEGETGALTARSAGVVLEDIDRLQSMLDGSGLPITGVSGALLKRIPETGAYDASKLIETIVGNIGFDRLQQMRDASPTGGALGAISERELSTLQSVLGSLDQGMSQKEFERNLSRLEEIYVGIMSKAAAYPNANDFGFTEPSSSKPVTIDGYTIQEVK